MHAVLIGEERLRAFAVRLHQKLLPVAAAAGDGNIGVTHRRMRIIGSQHFMRPTVAAGAGGRRRLRRGQFRVRAVRPRRLCILVAIRACYLLRRRVMRQALHVLVAIDAPENAAVDRRSQLLLVHKQADLLAVDLFRQCGVAMAGKAVLILELVLRGESAANEGKTEINASYQVKSCRVHAITMRRCANFRSDSGHKRRNPPNTRGEATGAAYRSG